jgi:hypothetical protein
MVYMRLGAAAGRGASAAECWQGRAGISVGQMRFFLFACSLAFGVVAGEAQAQVREEFMRCRAITDDERRLACYDGLNLSTASPLSKYEATALEDLQSYALSYRGRFVEVTGWIIPEGRFLSLRLSEADKRSLPVDIDRLARSDREGLLEICGEGCEALVQGRVGPVNFTTGIVADAVIAR